MALRQGEAGRRVADICRKLDISQASASIVQDCNLVLASRQINVNENIV